MPLSAKEKDVLRIGIVGAENSHALAVSKTINVDRKIPGARVVALWGEKPAFARKTADDGDIPVGIAPAYALCGEQPGERVPDDDVIHDASRSSYTSAAVGQIHTHAGVSRVGHRSQ